MKILLFCLLVLPAILWVIIIFVGVYSGVSEKVAEARAPVLCEWDIAKQAKQVKEASSIFEVDIKDKHLETRKSYNLCVYFMQTYKQWVGVKKTDTFKVRMMTQNTDTLEVRKMTMDNDYDDCLQVDTRALVMLGKGKSVINIISCGSSNIIPISQADEILQLIKETHGENE